MSAQTQRRQRPSRPSHSEAEAAAGVGVTLDGASPASASEPRSTTDASSGPGQPAERIHGSVWTPDGAVAEIDTTEGLQRAFADPSTRIWVDLEEAGSVTLLAVAECLGLHPLVVEDIIERNQRAKVEYADDYMHLVLFALAYEGEVVAGRTGHRAREAIPGRPRTRTPGDRSIGRVSSADGVPHFLSGGVDYLLWAVVDSVDRRVFPRRSIGWVTRSTISRTMSSTGPASGSSSGSSRSAATCSRSATR